VAQTTGIYSHCSGSQEPEIRILAGLVPAEDVRENLFQAALLASDGLLVMLGVLGL